MLDLIRRCFPAEMAGNSAWKRKLRKIIHPSANPLSTAPRSTARPTPAPPKP
jgi:hypothetical protein